MATLLKADGTRHQITDTLTLDRMQALVGGYIEVVRLPSEPQVLVVDDEGLLKPHPVLNVPASQLARQIIVGDVIWCEVHGEGTDNERWV